MHFFLMVGTYIKALLNRILQKYSSNVFNKTSQHIILRYRIDIKDTRTDTYYAAYL